MSKNAISEIKKDAFWNAFLQESEELRRQLIRGDSARVFGRIGTLLAEHGYDGVHEVTSDDSHGILVLTPESDPSMAQVVDDFAASAPQIGGWMIFTRRQRRDPEDALRIAEEVYAVDLDGSVFAMDDSGALHMYSPVAQELETDVGNGLVAFLMEHALGEEYAMNNIRHVSLHLLQSAPRDALPLHSFVNLNR